MINLRYHVVSLVAVFLALGLGVTKVNIDDNPGYASRYGVLSIPTLILFEHGEPRETVIGARPRSYFEKAWERWLS